MKNSIEQLERRLLMDGNVNAALNGGDLVVTGNSADNVIKITRTAAGKIRVAGLEGTKVNGGPWKEFAAGTFDDLKIRLRQGGEDQVAIEGPIKFAGDVDAQLNNGGFVIEGSAGAAEVGEELKVLGGSRCDVTLRNEVIVHGNTTIQTGGSVTAVANPSTVPNFNSARFTNPLDVDNPYFPLIPGAKYVYEQRSVDEETGEPVVETIVVEVTNQTKTILGVKTRVVRDRVFLDGLLIEDTFDWHAQDDNGNVWYFGEDTTDIEYDDEDNVIGTDKAGSWKAGVDGAMAGIIMQAKPRVGDRYFQEFAPGDVLDTGEVLSLNETKRVAIGSFTKVLRTKDVSVMEPESLDNKFYAPGLGLIGEDKFDIQTGEIHTVERLISATLNGKPVTSVVSPTGFGGINATGRRTGPVRLYGETLIRANGAAFLKQARLADELEIFSRSHVTVVESTLEDMTIQAGDSVGLRNVTATEEVIVRGNVDVYIFNSRFDVDTDIVLGAGDNELVIGKSSFRDLDADGGRGDDTFDDLGGNQFGQLELTHFEDA